MAKAHGTGSYDQTASEQAEFVDRANRLSATLALLERAKEALPKAMRLDERGDPILAKRDGRPITIVEAKDWADHWADMRRQEKRRLRKQRKRNTHGPRRDPHVQNLFRTSKDGSACAAWLWTGRANVTLFVVRSVFLSLLLVSCAHVSSTRDLAMPHCPANGGPPWVELVSPHFRLRTDLPRDRAKGVLRNFEAQLSPVATIVDSFIPGTEQPGETDLVVFARDEDFRWFMPDALGTFWAFDERSTPYIAMAERSATNEAHVIRHELVHRFIYRRLWHEPRWLNEGLAEYAAGGELHYKRYDAIPPVDAIVSADPTTFASSSSYYFGALMLFRWLADGTAEQRAGVRAFIREIAAGHPAYEAFVASVGKPAVLEAAFRAYLQVSAAAKPTEATVQPTTAAAPPAAVEIPIEEHPVAEAQLHHLWASLSGRHALMQLDDMRDHAGDSPLLHWLLARIAENRQDYVTADEELDRAVALAPGAPRWQRERAIMHAARIVSQRVPGTLASLDGELAAIARDSDDPRMLNSVAWFYAKSHRPQLGLPPAKRAVAARPENADMLDTLALLYYESGDAAEALRVQEEAVARLSEIGRVSQGLADRLQLYREAAHGR